MYFIQYVSKNGWKWYTNSAPAQLGIELSRCACALMVVRVMYHLTLQEKKKIYPQVQTSTVFSG